MHLRIVFLTTGLALWNLAFTLSTPVPIARERDFEFDSSQSLVYYDAAKQVPIAAPSPLSVTEPPPSQPTLPAPPATPTVAQTNTTATPTQLSVDTYPTHFTLPEWVIAPYPLGLIDEDRVGIFDTLITGLTLVSKKYSFLGNNNAGIYAVSSFSSDFAEVYFPPNPTPNALGSTSTPDPSQLLVKVLKDIDDDMIAEVKALKIVGQFVASGKMNVQMGKARKMKKGGSGDFDDESIYEVKPIIVMLKMPGQALTSTPGFRAAKDMETKRRMMGDTLTMMCNKVGEMALEYGFVHRDNIIPNIMVIADGTEIIDVNIIDWGGKYLSLIRDDVTWDDLMAWCHRRWAVPVWERGL